MLFSDRSLLTMLHGIGMGGGALLALSAALFAVYLLRPRAEPAGLAATRAGAISAVTAIAAGLTWLTTLAGTYIIFPPYRATPPEGAIDLAAYPRSKLLAEPGTAWLHAFAMETKEHLPFIAAMLVTSVAFVAWRYRERLLEEAGLRRLGESLLLVCFAIVAYVSLLGVFVNKVAPLE